MVAKSSQRPFESNIILLSILILHKLLIFLVDRIVGQMHVAIVLVKFGAVRFRGKSCETFLVNIHSQRLIRSDHYINTEVKFVAVDQERIGHVAGND